MPSASGQKMVSMPVMVPLADVLEITRQTAVLAFNTGYEFSNMMIPAKRGTYGDRWYSSGIV
ncbi:hypothetical protein [Saccharicrinis sp. 156]|uniref:hypothetical protein n=1 Tax=Saccharicrinis sp. 156 TaxID=3417574 RepID=UPI003D344BE2